MKKMQLKYPSSTRKFKQDVEKLKQIVDGHMDVLEQDLILAWMFVSKQYGSRWLSDTLHVQPASGIRTMLSDYLEVMR